MSTTLSCILLALFCAIGGYIIGLNRGNDTHRFDYDDGYDNGWSDCVDTINSNLDELEVKCSKKTEWDETREQKARELIEQLDDLFEDDEDNEIDCGEY